MLSTYAFKITNTFQVFTKIQREGLGAAYYMTYNKILQLILE